MLALWYTILSYKEYRDTIWDKLSSKKPPAPKETAVVCPLPAKKTEPPSKIPVAEPPKPQPQPPQRTLPTPPPTPQPTSIPKPEKPLQQKMEPPPKPPRAPSPHPIKAEALDDDIEYDEESEESDEPDEEDSVLATPQFQRKLVAKSVNEFIDKEKM